MRCDGDEEVGGSQDVCLDKFHWEAESKADGREKTRGSRLQHMAARRVRGRRKRIEALTGEVRDVR